MRRLTALLVAVLGALALLPGLALADAAPDAPGLDAPGLGADLAILAVDDAPAGPDPAPRDAEDNPARDLGDYGDREIPFTWGAAWLLTAIGFIGLVLLLLIYRFRVAPPSKDRAST
ncbi:MAG: hypothetical protein EA387_11745 [Nitriliruptor sp.]|nr:MAG: hypothetical protein EA387_11745 [Nitriliruptor sp.]